MSAPFRVPAWAFASSAFDVLGDLAGYNRHEALGRWARAGSEATDRQSYVFTEAAVRGLFGPHGVEGLLAAELAERVEGGLRMCRMDGEIEWFADISSKRRAAGQARAAKAKRDERGRLLPSSTSSTPPARAGVLDQHATSTEPPHSSSPAPAPAPDRSEDSLSRARAGVPPDQRKALRDRAWGRLNAKRAEFPGTRALNLHDPGYTELATRIVESGTDAEANVEHVLAIAFAEADAKGTPEFLSGSMFERRSWSKKLSLRVEDIKRRSGPKRSIGASVIDSNYPETEHAEVPFGGRS